MLEVILMRFEQPDEVSNRREGQIRSGSAGRIVHRPRHLRTWLEMVDACGQGHGATSCRVEHVGMVVSGRTTAAMDDGWCSK